MRLERTDPHKHHFKRNKRRNGRGKTKKNMQKLNREDLREGESTQ